MYGSGLAVLSLLLLIDRPSYADWTHFRHDACHTGCTDEAVSPPLELRWQFIGVPESDADDKSAAERPPCFATRLRGGIPYQTRAPHMLAGRGQLLLSGPVCLDGETGEVLWQHPWAAGIVIVENGLVVLNCRSPADPAGLNAIVACEVATGEVRWELPPDRYYASATRGRLLWVSFLPWFSGPYRVFTVNLLDGSVAERYDIPPHALSDPPGPHQGWVGAWGREVMVISPWEPLSARPPSRVLWGFLADGTPLFTPGRVYAGVSQMPATMVALHDDLGLVFAIDRYAREHHHLLCLDAMTGGLIWRRPLLSSPSDEPPVVASSGVYLGLADGVVYALEPTSGALKWQTSVVEPAATGPDAENGEPEAEREPDEASLEEATQPSEPAPLRAAAPRCSLAGDTLWVIYRGKLLALDAETGDIEWKTEETEACCNEPVIHNGFVYLLTCRGVEAWGPPTGRAKAKEEGDKPNEEKTEAEPSPQ